MTATLSPEFVAAREAFAQWYDSKDADTQELIDSIAERTSFIIDEEEYDAFILQLARDLDITNAAEFEDAFYAEYEYIGDRITAKFAEDFCEDVYPTDELPDVYKYAIDYQLVWYSMLRHDFYDLEFKGNTYIFNRNY